MSFESRVGIDPRRFLAAFGYGDVRLIGIRVRRVVGMEPVPCTLLSALVFVLERIVTW